MSMETVFLFEIYAVLVDELHCKLTVILQSKRYVLLTKNINISVFDKSNLPTITDYI